MTVCVYYYYYIIIIIVYDILLVLKCKYQPVTQVCLEEWIVLYTYCVLAEWSVCALHVSIFADWNKIVYNFSQLINSV